MALRALAVALDGAGGELAVHQAGMASGRDVSGIGLSLLNSPPPSTHRRQQDGTARVVSTIDKWIAEKPEFSGAIKEGREIADA